jgi:transposase
MNIGCIKLAILLQYGDGKWTMVTKQIKELEATKAKIVALEKSIAKRLRRELASLHRTYGYGTLDEFVKALKTASGAMRKVRRGRPAKAAAKVKRRKRAVITDETRTSVKKLVESGKTGSQIARTLGISLPSVQNIKKALGLVKARA